MEEAYSFHFKILFCFFCLLNLFHLKTHTFIFYWAVLGLCCAVGSLVVPCELVSCSLWDPRDQGGSWALCRGGWILSHRAPGQSSSQPSGTEGLWRLLLPKRPSVGNMGDVSVPWTTGRDEWPQEGSGSNPPPSPVGPTSIPPGWAWSEEGQA